MRSLKMGIVGLALIGGGALVPQDASATASFDLQMTSTLSHTLATGTATVIYRNYFPGITRSETTTGDATVDFVTNPTPVPNLGNLFSSSTGATFGANLTGSATGQPGVDALAAKNNGMNLSTTADTQANSSMLGTVISIVNLSADTTFNLMMTLDTLLQTSVDNAVNESASAQGLWMVTMQQRVKGSGASGWSSWGPADGQNYFIGSTVGGQANYGYAQVTGTGSDESMDFTDKVFAIGMSAANDYRLRVSFEMAGSASSTAPVPVPAALPLLGAALGGLGLMARRRKS